MTEARRMFASVDKKYHWKLTSVNSDYSICGSYPPRHYVPPYFDDTALKQVAAFRDGNRFPAFSWIHPGTAASLVRCSQPLPGRLGGKRCPEDEQLLAQIWKCNPESPDFGGYILDARPYSSAMANRAMGAGFEKTEHYNGVRVEFLGIENIHVVRDSLEKLKRAVKNALPGFSGPGGIFHSGVNGLDISGWLERLSDSGWLKHLQTVLNGSILAATLLHARKTSVVVHCSHGWDRTAQLTSLPMLMLDSYYRTFTGFQVLVEKEWVAYGHKFFDRCNHISNPTLAAKEESPIFLQFIDCVHQLLRQFPAHFEFNDKFLIDLVDAVYSCQYGTFLGNNHAHHLKLETAKKTVSVWTYFNHSSVKPQYLNPMYDAVEARKEAIQFLKPSTAGNKLVFWEALYNRSDNDPSFDDALLAKYTELKTTSDQLQSQLDKLKAELAHIRSSRFSSSKVFNDVTDEGDAIVSPATLTPSNSSPSLAVANGTSTPGTPSAPATPANADPSLVLAPVASGEVSHAEHPLS